LGVFVYHIGKSSQFTFIKVRRVAKIPKKPILQKKKQVTQLIIAKHLRGKNDLDAVKLKSVIEDLLLSAERDDVRMTLPFLY
jgi:hypothetical protein